MTAGRNRKPISLIAGHKTKAEIREREQIEDAYTVGRLHLVPPDELTPRAKLFFEQIANTAFWLDELSTGLLAQYCQAYDKWLTLVELINDEPESIIEVDGNGTEHLKPNPNRKALIDYGIVMQQISSKLALGNIDRLKLSLPSGTEKPVNKFAKFA